MFYRILVVILVRGGVGGFGSDVALSLALPHK